MLYDRIFIDATNLFFRSVYFGLGKELSTKSIAETFFQIIDSIKTKFEHTGEIYFLYDDSQNLLRRQIQISYKSNRQKAKLPNNIFSCLGLTKQILSMSSSDYRIVSSSGYETDDLLKPLLKTFSKESKNLLITNDLDWCVNLNENTHWFNWSDILTKSDFINKYTFYPNHESIKLYKALKGDKTSGIKSIVNISNDSLYMIVRRAINYTSFDNFENDLSWLEEKDRLEIKSKLNEVYSNYQLCELIGLQKPIQDCISHCRVSNLHRKILLESVGLQLKLSKEEIENSFFDLL